MKMTMPLVSVLTPTFGRPELLARAIRIFHSYRYPRKEMIIVDDSPEPYTGQLGAAVRYTYLKDRTVLGEKHNIAAALAQGDILAHRDDDDLFSPMSLTRQVELMLLSEVAITGFRMNYLRDERTGDFYHFKRGAIFNRSDPTTVPIFTFHDSTSAYRREIWDAGLQYSKTQVAQKVHLLNDAIRAGFAWSALENDGHFVYSRHGVNTWNFERKNMVDAPAPSLTAYAWLGQLTGRAA